MSPSARKCYEYLVDGTDTNRHAALKLIDNLSPGEKAIIANEVFAIIERSSSMNVEVLRSYADFSVKAGMIGEALNKLMEQPASKYTIAAYGQLSSFISELSDDEAKRFKDYLSTNSGLQNAITRGEKLNSITKKK